MPVRLPDIPMAVPTPRIGSLRNLPRVASEGTGARRQKERRKFVWLIGITGSIGDGIGRQPEAVERDQRVRHGVVTKDLEVPAAHRDRNIHLGRIFAIEDKAAGRDVLIVVEIEAFHKRHMAGATTAGVHVFVEVVRSWV